MESVPKAPRVLILDDDHATLTLERKVLERAGHTVFGALTPEAATEIAGREAPDLLVLDYRIGRAVSGLEFFQTLRASGHDLPAILVTSFSDEARIIEALRTGIRDVVPKSGDYLDYLPQAVERVVEQRRAERRVAESDALRHLVERLRQETQTLETINRVGRLMAAELDLERLVQTITDACTELTGAAFGAFFYNTTGPAGDAYTLYTLSGASREEFSRFPMPRSTELFGPTFRGEAVVRCDDVKADPRYGKSAPHYGLPAGHLPVRSYLAVPVVSRSGTTLGGLFFGHPDCAVFTDRHAHIVQSIAAQASVAMDNAHLVEALRGSEDRVRLATEATRLGTWDYHPLSGHLQWSPRCRVLHGVGEEREITYDLFLAGLHPDHRLRTDDMVRGALDPAGTGTYLTEYLVVGVDDGVERWIRAAGQAYFTDGRAVRFIGTVQDITDERRSREERERLLESERAARAESERANRLKDEFLATLSHELRTPLNAILGWSQLLRTRERSPQEIVEGLQTIERNARVQAQLVEDLLEMSRIVSGKLRLDVQRVELGQIISTAIDSVRPAADAKDIRLQVTLDPRTGLVAGDPARIHQVLWNLLSNAIKFTPKGGRVQVILERVNSHVEVTVSDTGQGIKPEFLPYLFDRFRQADASTTREHRGMGLGLSIVKSLVEMHGGTVTARSDGEGHGATFIVTLPITAIRAEPEDGGRVHPVARPSALASLDVPRLTGVRVLIVDDEPDARELLSRILVEYDAEVQAVASATEALPVLQRDRPDVLVSDIGMPQLDGYQFIRAVRLLPADRGGQTPALALTAFARSEDRQRALLAGYQGHIAKPVEPAELITIIASLAGRLGSRG